jgi:hypothetical protein
MNWKGFGRKCSGLVKIESGDILERLWENYENPQSHYLVTRPKFEPSTYRLQVYSVISTQARYIKVQYVYVRPCQRPFAAMEA